jgi:hypothetical protein
MRFSPTAATRFSLTAATALLLAGCDPLIDIALANFPASLFCAICGAVLTAVNRPVFVVTRVESYLWPVPVVYLSLAILMGFVVDPRPYQAALDSATAKLQLAELDIRALEDRDPKCPFKTGYTAVVTIQGYREQDSRAQSSH